MVGTKPNGSGISGPQGQVCRTDFAFGSLFRKHSSRRLRDLGCYREHRVRFMSEDPAFTARRANEAATK